MGRPTAKLETEAECAVRLEAARARCANYLLARELFTRFNEGSEDRVRLAVHRFRGRHPSADLLDLVEEGKVEGKIKRSRSAKGSPLRPQHPSM